MVEEWRDVEGYDGRYKVSNFGRVKSTRDRGVVREKILRLSPNGTGYLIVGLSKDGSTKQFLVHRLVASAFIDNPNGYEFVNHKDENKENNVPDNLEWCTKSYNSIYYLNKDPRRKLQYASRFRDKETNEMVSPYCKKNVAHTNTRKVAQISLSGELIGTYDNSASACEKTGIHYSSITRACKLNESGRPKQHNRVSDQYVSHGYVWKYIDDEE